MRIAFYAPLKPPDHPMPSGDRMVARELVKALRRARHEVEIASRFRSYDRGDPERQARLAATGGRLAERIASRMARSARIDAWLTYHLYHKAPDWLGPRVSERLGIPYVVAEASYAGKQAGGPWRLGHEAVSEALARADLLLALNPADVEGVRPLLSSSARLEILPPFLDAAPLRAVPRQAARASLAVRTQLPRHEPWLLAAAMMRSDQKLASYRLLAEALTMLRAHPWRLLVAGAGPAEREVRRTFSALSDRVTWLGLLPPNALRTFYGAADLYVWPAIKEAWSMSILEAQAAGLPVVAGRSGGVPGVVEDRETALLAAEGDAPAFAANLRRLLLHPQRRRSMGRAAARRAAREHDGSVAAGRLDRALRNACERYSGRW